MYSACCNHLMQLKCHFRTKRKQLEKREQSHGVEVAIGLIHGHQPT